MCTKFSTWYTHTTVTVYTHMTVLYSWVSMNSILFILLLSKGVYGEAFFIPLLKTEVSKVDYASKATAVRVQTFEGSALFFIPA